MRHVCCDLCGADDADLFAERPPRRDVLHRRFVRCRRCGLVYADPRAEPDDARRHYESVSDRGSSALGASVESAQWRATVAGRKAHLERAAFNVETESQSIRFLEVGFGDASALVAARELGWEPYGLEYAEWLADDARRRHGLKHVHVSDVIDAPYEERTFDVVYAWHVIEHVLDVDAWLERVASLLKPGGVAMIGTENAAGAYGRMWRLAFRVLGRTPWPPTSTDHTYWFTASQLAQLLCRHGLEPRAIRAYENRPLEILRSQQIGGLRNPRWVVSLAVYIASAVLAVPAPRLGGKLEALATRGLNGSPPRPPTWRVLPAAYSSTAQRRWPM
jgi:2-polyprenyl-3-methyl-5-hydroxy-6-metoxy-1,4-benzoquinol methylase